MALGHPGTVAAGSLGLMAETAVEVQKPGCWEIEAYQAD